MKCYIKDKVTFATKYAADVSEYDVYLHTIFDDKSKLTVFGKHSTVAGDFVVFGDWIGVIDSVKVSNGTTKLTCSDLITLFDLDFYILGTVNYDDWADEINVKNEIAGAIGGGYMGNFPTIGHSFITSSFSTQTGVPPILPTVDGANSHTNSKEYIEKVRRFHNVHIVSSVSHLSTGDVLLMDARQLPTVNRKIDFSDKSIVLLKEEYSAIQYTVVMGMYVASGSTEPGTYTEYLKTDGTIGVYNGLPPTNWQTGKAKIILVTEDDYATSVRNEILKTKSSHLIEFSTEIELGFFDNTEIRLNGQIFNSYISSVRITSETNRYIYTSGELKTGVLNKIKELKQ